MRIGSGKWTAAMTAQTLSRITFVYKRASSRQPCARFLKTEAGSEVLFDETGLASMSA
jgi:hypothetical protein